MNKLGIDKLKNVPSNLSSLKGKSDELDTGKLETTPVDLSKLNDVVKNEVVKKTEYNKELIKKVNAIQTQTTDTNNLVQKTDYDTKSSKTETKINGHDFSNKYITTHEINKLTSENFAAWLSQAKLATKVDIGNFIKKTNFHDNLKNLNKNILQMKQNI